MLTFVDAQFLQVLALLCWGITAKATFNPPSPMAVVETATLRKIRLLMLFVITILFGAEGKRCSKSWLCFQGMSDVALLIIVLASILHMFIDFNCVVKQLIASFCGLIQSVRLWRINQVRGGGPSLWASWLQKGLPGNLLPSKSGCSVNLPIFLLGKKKYFFHNLAVIGKKYAPNIFFLVFSRKIYWSGGMGEEGKSVWLVNLT